MDRDEMELTPEELSFIRAIVDGYAAPVRCTPLRFVVVTPLRFVVVFC